MRLNEIVTAVLVTLWLSGCQTETASSTSGVSDLGSLPKATSPVSRSSAVMGASRDTQLFTAATGVKLRSAHSTTWSSAKSRPMCEMSRVIRDAYLQAATPDAMICIISAISNRGGFGSTIYDGNFKHMVFGVDGFGAGSVRLKMKAVKSGGALQTFNMFACQGDGTTYTQTGYIGQDLTSNAAAAVTSVYNATVGSYTLGSRCDVTGAVGSTGAWSSKTITSKTKNVTGGKTFSSKSSITQYYDRIEVDSFQDGQYSTNTFTNRLYGVVQLIGADSLTNFALGDGSARYILDFNPSDSRQHYDSAKSWTGDDTLPVADPTSNGAYYSTVSSKTPRSTETISTAFTDAETWDCTAGEGQFSTLVFLNISVDLVTDVIACIAAFADATTSNIDCSSATGE